MGWPRFSLRTLLVGVTLFAVACATFLATPNYTLSRSVLALAMVVLLVGPIGIAYRKGENRAFWMGAATIGWGYLLATHSEVLGLRELMRDAIESVCRPMRPSLSDFNVWQLEPLGHAYTALLLAFAGGLLAHYFFQTNESPEKLTHGTREVNGTVR